MTVSMSSLKSSLVIVAMICLIISPVMRINDGNNTYLYT